MSRTPVGIVGFRGYSGAELHRLLEKHPSFEPVLLDHRSDAADQPGPRGSLAPRRAAFSPDQARADGLAAVFLATPHEVSMEVAGGLLDAGIKVVDLSGAFRLRTPEVYKRWYKHDHTAASLLPQAVYGLPEFCRERIAGAKLLSNPGCYPTAANLAIRPLVEAGVVLRGSGVICDAKSGVSGAGRKPALKTSFCEVTENFSTYSVLDHRHVPEVLQNSGLEESEFTFTAQLLPLHRGILETIYVRTERGVSAEDLVALYERAYAGRPFVRIYDPGVMPDLRPVQFTNFCDIGVKCDSGSGRAVIVSVIDNLGKGAAGQAIQNLNIMFGLPETEGLL